MGKGQYENTKGMDYQDIFNMKFLPMLMDKIGDADEYQRLYDSVFKKGRFIRGSAIGKDDSRHLCDQLGIDRSKMSNLEVLFNVWYNDDDAFNKDFNLLINIDKNDPEAIKIRDEYLKTHPYVKSHYEEKEEKAKQQESTEQPKEIVSEAAYTPNTTAAPNTRPDTVVQSMSNNIPEQNVFNSSVSRDDEDKERVTFSNDVFVLQSLKEIRNYLISYPEDYMPKSAYTIPTVLPPKQLLANKSTSQLVKRTSFEFMLDFNNDNLKDCLDKNAPTTINNITERFEEWRSAFGIPVIFSKLYTMFWNLLLITMDDDLYNKHLSEVVNLAHRLSIDENLLQDLCHGVEYVLSGKKLGQDCDLQCKTAEGEKFFLHK